MLRIGILSPSEIAARRFIPALMNTPSAEFAGIACASVEEREGQSDEAHVKASLEKTQGIADTYEVPCFASFAELLGQDSIDAVYVPLPPALHFQWATRALEAGKHVMLEKPFTPNPQLTQELIQQARQAGLAAHENYAFIYHDRVKQIQTLLADNALGELRAVRAAFGFPYRGESDFRYHANMGGGALLDCGGYPIRMASLLLGETAQVQSSLLGAARGHDVDVYGSLQVVNDDKLVAQLGFGMDNSYKCDLEIWGSIGYLRADRIFTPTADMETTIEITGATDAAGSITCAPCDQFQRSIEHLVACVNDDSVREETYSNIIRQSVLVQSTFDQAQ